MKQPDINSMLAQIERTLASIAKQNEFQQDEPIYLDHYRQRLKSRLPDASEGIPWQELEKDVVNLNADYDEWRQRFLHLNQLLENAPRP